MSRRTDHTPDTHDVRAAYKRQISRLSSGATMTERRENAAAEFDRWLTQTQADAWREGHQAGLRDALAGPHSMTYAPTENPYA